MLLWVVVFLFFFGGFDTSGGETLDRVVFAAITATASTYLAVRPGLLAFVTFTFVGQTMISTIVTLDPTDWYFAPTAIFVVLVAALTGFGIKTSTDQKLFPSRP